MRRCLLLSSLLLATVPFASLAQQQCNEPRLAETRISPWHKNQWDSTIVGNANYRIAALDAAPGETATLGIALSHFASDESRGAGEPDNNELAEVMTSELQFRWESKDHGPARTWVATDAQVKVDGKVFKSRFDVQAADPKRAAVVNWQVWFSDTSLMDVLERAKNVEVVLLDGSKPVARYNYDVASFKDVRRKLLPYWRCTARPFHQDRR